MAGMIHRLVSAAAGFVLAALYFLGVGHAKRLGKLRLVVGCLLLDIAIIILSDPHWLGPY
jgi:hypothetical protein